MLPYKNLFFTVYSSCINILRYSCLIKKRLSFDGFLHESLQPLASTVRIPASANSSILGTDCMYVHIPANRFLIFPFFKSLKNIFHYSGCLYYLSLSFSHVCTCVPKRLGGGHSMRAWPCSRGKTQSRPSGRFAQMSPSGSTHPVRQRCLG